MQNHERVLPQENLSLLEKIFQSTQKALINSMTTFLQDIYGYENVSATEKFIVAVGDIPVGLVAHADTVHRTPVIDLYYDRQKNVMWSPQGLGADDRAGIYGIIEIVQRGLRPTIIITTDEEIGGLGAIEVAHKIQNPDLNFLIELDRRGYDDCVFYDCDNEEFEVYIEKFGFTTSWGSFSDICHICPAWGIAGVNLSIGYYSEHTSTERLVVHEMLATIDKVEDILNNVNSDDKFKYVPLVTSYSKYFYSKGKADIYDSYAYHGYSSAYGYDFEDDNSGLLGGAEMDYCFSCMGTFKSDDLLISEDNMQYCEHCYNKYYTMCTECGKDFYNYTKEHGECEECRVRGAGLDV